MTYSDKRGFAARVFAAVRDQRWAVVDCERCIFILAQAQLDALPDEGQAGYADAVYSDGNYDGDIDAAYVLAVKLAPLVGVTIPAR